jgi:hypothetical protein
LAQFNFLESTMSETQRKNGIMPSGSRLDLHTDLTLCLCPEFHMQSTTFAFFVDFKFLVLFRNLNRAFLCSDASKRGHYSTCLGIVFCPFGASTMKRGCRWPSPAELLASRVSK